MKRVLWSGLALALILAAVLTACSQPTPEVITVVETVEKIVEKEGETITVVETQEVEVVVTATPEPTASPYDENATIEVWVDATRIETMDMFAEAFPEKAALINVSQSNRGQFADQMLFFNNVGEGWPDVVFAEPWIVSQLADAAHNWAADLSPWVSQETLDGFYPGSLDPCWIEGKLYCLRNDLAETILYYNIPMMEEYGFEVPDTWEEYIAIGEEIANQGLDLIIGACGDAECGNMYMATSGCPMTERLSFSQIRVNADHPNCVRAAEMVDYLTELGVIVPMPPRSPAFVEQYVAEPNNKMLMYVGPSWAGEYIFGGNEESMYYKTAEGQLGMAVVPNWEGEPKRAGFHGGAAWAMSRHTKNPQLASEVVIWVTTGPYQDIAPTQPAYMPAAENWADTVRGNAMYGVDPWEVYDEAATYIWGGWLQDNRLNIWPAWQEICMAPYVNEGAKLADCLEPLEAELARLAPAGGFEPITDGDPEH
jgi:multiple sugar transport system substrate-binding protein